MAVMVVALVLGLVLGIKPKPVGPPSIIETDQPVYGLTPHYHDQLYLYSIKSLGSLDTKTLLKSLRWNSNFLKDRQDVLKGEFQEHYVKSKEELIKKLVNERDELLTKLHLPKQHQVFPIDQEMFAQLVGPESFYEILRYIGPSSKWKHINLWVNGSGYTTWMHGDVSHGFALHLTGKKRWVFADKSYLKNCAPRKNSRGHLYCQAKDPYDQTLAKSYPKFSKIQYLHKDIYPGDMINVPIRMLHFVHTIETCCMISIITYNQ